MAKKRKAKRQAKPRPKLKAVRTPLRVIEETLTVIVREKADTGGPLDPEELVQAKKTLKGIKDALAAFPQRCIQGFAAY